jgi:hypothetical protein
MTEGVGIVPTFEHDIGILVPDTRASIVGTEVCKEIFETVCVGLIGCFNDFSGVALLTTISTHHNTSVISQTDVSDIRIIKLLESTG